MNMKGILQQSVHIDLVCPWNTTRNWSPLKCLSGSSWHKLSVLTSSATDTSHMTSFSCTLQEEDIHCTPDACWGKWIERNSTRHIPYWISPPGTTSSSEEAAFCPAEAATWSSEPNSINLQAVLATNSNGIPPLPSTGHKGLPHPNRMVFQVLQVPRSPESQWNMHTAGAVTRELQGI